MIYRKLGTTQMEILEFLGTHPNKLILQVSNALRKDKKNVYNNIHILQKYGLVEKGKMVTSATGTDYQGYRLTMKGVAYCYADDKVKPEDILKIARNYEGTSVDGQLFLQLASISKKTTAKILHLIGRAKLNYGDDVWDDRRMFTRLLFSVSLHLSNSEMRDLRRAVKSVPELKEEVVRTLEGAKQQFLDSEDSKYPKSAR